MKLPAGTLLFLLFSFTASAWMQSVEFPWNSYPQPLWERELVRLKDTGITHVSLPPGKDAEQLAAVIRIVRRLNLEADLEAPVPETLQPLTKEHGGPLTAPAIGAIRISALAPDALMRSRKLLLSARPAIIWTDATDTLGAAGFHSGAVSFNGREGPAALSIRRNAQLIRYWGETLPALHHIPDTEQYTSENGTSFLSAVNDTAAPVTSERKAFYAPLKRTIVLPNVTIPAHDVLWLPVNIPLVAGPFCKACTAFATVDHLVYATAELTAMEYENGILAMEFSAPVAGEVILQLSRQPSGPLVAGGKPTEFDWDEHALRARLPIPKGTGTGNHVRIGLAIEPPDATAFFENARVLTIGETNSLTAEFSSTSISQRSRLRTVPDMTWAQDATKNDLETVYRIKVPDTAIPGDHADLWLEADGSQMSHVHPQLLKPAELLFPDADSIRLSANSSLPLFPATIAVNQRSGREVTVAIRNNAPEIRTFALALKGEGLQFSPATMNVVVGASVSREVTFRVFPSGTLAGVHAGEARLSGAANAVEPIRFVVIPPAAAVAFASSGFAVLESEKFRAAFFSGRWLEFLNKDNAQNSIPAGGILFHPGPVETAGDALIFAGQHRFRIADLENLAPKPKK